MKEPIEKLALDLYLAFETDSSSFRSQIYRLFPKADAINFAKLETAFPREANLYLEWYHSPTAKDLYKKYKILKQLKGDEEKRVYRARFMKKKVKS